MRNPLVQSDAPTGWKDMWKRTWSAPDPDLVDAGLRGEWMVAGIRLLIIVLLLYFPLQRYVEAPDEGGRTTILWLAAAALAEALVIYSAVRRSWGRGWIGFFSGLLDVSLVSLALGMYIRLGQPLSATNSLVIFPVYLLAIGATSLRYDWRICVLTGLGAVTQYFGLVYYAVWQWDLDNPVLGLYGGQFNWSVQMGRIMLLVMATILATSLVVRALEQRSLSNRDRLTQLANRGFFDESLMRMGALAERSGEPIAVAMIDVDHFKKFNDTYGHQAGDEALRTVAGVLGTSFRTTDLLARYGGEEFAGLFPGLKTADAKRRLDVLRELIERTLVPIDARGGKTKVTVSIGVAVWPQEGMSLTETLAIADLRLYQAKNAGRNRVVAMGGKGRTDDDGEA